MRSVSAHARMLVTSTLESASHVASEALTPAVAGQSDVSSRGAGRWRVMSDRDRCVLRVLWLGKSADGSAPAQSSSTGDED